MDSLLLFLLLVAPVMGNLGATVDDITTKVPQEGCPERCPLCMECKPGSDKCVPSTDPRCRQPSPGVILAAQIVLGAALVIAGGAIVSVVMRACTRRREARRNRGNSRTSWRSLDAFVARRLRDSPPKYDEISWDKPPSYCSASGTPLPQVRNMEVNQGFAVPPTYDNPVFTVEASAAQMRDAESRQAMPTSTVSIVTSDSTLEPDGALPNVFSSPGVTTS